MLPFYLVPVVRVGVSALSARLGGRGGEGGTGDAPDLVQVREAGVTNATAPSVRTFALQGVDLLQRLPESFAIDGGHGFFALRVSNGSFPLPPQRRQSAAPTSVRQCKASA